MTNRVRISSIAFGACLIAAEAVTLAIQTSDSKCIAEESVRVWTPISPAVIVTSVDIPVGTQGRVLGSVIADVWIDEAGMVNCVKITRSIPLYDAAVIESLSHWQFRPAMLLERPVAVVQSVIVPVPTPFFPGSRPRSPAP